MTRMFTIGYRNQFLVDDTVTTRDLVYFAERHAIALRQQAQVGPLEALDPRKLGKFFKLQIAQLDEIVAVTPEQRAYMSKVNPKEWSGAGIELPNNRWLVLLHPLQTIERARVTTMEEVAHVYFGHKPTRIERAPDGQSYRHFDKRIEQEAYWTAAAALLPSKAVGLAVYRKQSAESLAAKYGVSVELVMFRIKILNLWAYYSNHDSTQGA